MGYVFISYSRADSHYVQALAGHLLGSGLDVWYDDELRNGDDWRRVVRHRVESCDAFVVVMTPPAEASEWVNREIDWAVAANRPVRPVLLEGASFQRLDDLHHEAVQGAAMPGRRYVAGLRRLAGHDDDLAEQVAPRTPQAAVPARDLPAGGTVSSIAFSPDGFHVAGGTADGGLHVWNARTGATVHTMRSGDGLLSAVAYRGDGRVLATAGWEATVRLWDPFSGELIRTLDGPTQDVNGMVFAGPRLLSVGEDTMLRVWDAAGHRLDLAVPHAEAVQGIAADPTGRLLATAGADGQVVLWDAQALRPVTTLAGHTDGVAAVAFSPTGDRLASAGRDHTVRLWRTADGTTERVLTGHVEKVWTVAVSRDGRQVASGGDDRTVRVWDAATGEQLHRFKDHGGQIWGVAYSPAAAWLAVACGSRTHSARILDLTA
ncbi:TIR domain-containing protein [Dactylosporangium sp. NPDC049525]|uniref:WD40 repeat domain-containing protein n=1 Tax=Dactylosporangium sp. NPDC049525 TaxID=3154730 RepID=UPI00342D7A05